MIRALLLLAVLLVILAGCGDVRLGPADPPKPPPSVAEWVKPEVEARAKAESERDAAIKTSVDARQDAIKARQEAAAARSLAAEKEAEATRLDGVAKAMERAEVASSIRRWSWWLVGVGLLAAVAAIPIAIWLGAVRTAAILAGCGIGVAGIGFVGLWLAPAWVIIARAVGGVLALAVLGAGTWAARRIWMASREAAAHGDRVEDAALSAAGSISEDVRLRIATAVQAAKHLSAIDQADAGLQRLVARVRRKPVKPVSALLSGEGTGHSQ
jgi:hypothetical protein